MNQGVFESEGGDRVTLLEFVMSIRRKFRKLFSNKKERISRLFKISLDILILETEEPTEEWLNPPDGFKEDENEPTSEKLILAMVD